jgi:hypothetical protein
MASPHSGILLSQKRNKAETQPHCSTDETEHRATHGPCAEESTHVKYSEPADAEGQETVGQLPGQGTKGRSFLRGDRKGT